MKIRFSFLLAVCLASLSLRSSQASDDPVDTAKRWMHKSPLQAAKVLEKAEDKDDKFSLAYRIDVLIAEKVDPAVVGGVWNQHPTQNKPSELDQYVIDRKERFRYTGEGSFQVIPTNFWIRKVGNTRHPVHGDYDFQDLRIAFMGGTEGGACKKHQKDLFKRIDAFEHKWKNKFADEIKKMREHLKCQDVSS